MSEVINIKELNERIERESVFVDTLNLEMSKVIVGQKHLVDTLLIGLLSNGHILLEGCLLYTSICRRRRYGVPRRRNNGARTR